MSLYYKKKWDLILDNSRYAFKMMQNFNKLCSSFYTFSVNIIWYNIVMKFSL